MKKAYYILPLALLPWMNSIGAISEEEIAKGVLAIEDKRYNEAYKFFNSFLNEYPKNAVGLYYRSQAALGKGDKGTALNDINLAIKSGGGFMKKKEVKKEDLYVQRGVIYKAMGDTKTAITDFNTALTINPNCIDALIYRGQIHADSKDYETSNAEYKQALTIDDASYGANMGIAKNQVSQGEYTEAINTLKKLDQLYPENTEIYTLRGDIYVLLGKYKEAFDDEMVLITFQEDYNAAMPQLIARAMQCETYSLPKISQKVKEGENIDLWLQTRAAMYKQLDRYDDAIADYNALESELKESYAPICLGRGDCYKSKGDYASAEKEYLKANTLEVSAKAYAGLSQMKLNEAKTDSALYYINKAINTNPQEADLYLLRGKIQEVLNKKDDAMNAYNTGLGINNNDNSLRLAKAKLLSRTNARPQAEEIAENIINSEKTQLPANNCSPIAYLISGREPEGTAQQEKILNRFPTISNYYDASIFYAANGDNEKAIAQLDKAFEKGYKEYGTLANENELTALKQTPEYAALMKKWNIANTPVKTAAPKDTASNGDKVDMPIIPCTVDGMKLTFTTNNDTAKIFTISLLDVQMLVKYGYMAKNDVIAQRDQKLDIANIPVGSKVVLRTFKWGKKELRGVEATIVEDPNAPILITQGMLNEIDK